jgi:hypothetical protein
MYKRKLGRREALSGSLAAFVAPAPSSDGHLVTPTLPAITAEAEPGLLVADARHAPFRAAFHSWLSAASKRFALPVSAHAVSPSRIDLRVPGLHPAIEVAIANDHTIDVYVIWKGIFWDSLAWLGAIPKPMADGTGWQDQLRLPEARRLHPTQEACWREDGFESLLRWINDHLAAATHFVLLGGDDCYEGEDWTAAHLVRDGLVLPWEKHLSLFSAVRETIPLYAFKA